MEQGSTSKTKYLKEKKTTACNKDVHRAAKVLLKEDLLTLNVYIKMNNSVKELIFYFIQKGEKIKFKINRKIIKARRDVTQKITGEINKNQKQVFQNINKIDKLDQQREEKQTDITKSGKQEGTSLRIIHTRKDNKEI